MFLLFLSFKTFKRAVKQARDVWKWSFHGNNELCRTIGPLLSQRLPLASAKAQPRGFFVSMIFFNYHNSTFFGSFLET